MTQCKKIGGRHRQVCIGSLDKLITLKIRAITEPAEDSVDYAETFTTLDNVWSQIKTDSRGEVIFDRTNTVRQVSHHIWMRYRDDVTTEVWLEWEGKKYDILSVEDLEEKHEWLFFKAVKRGDKTLPINQI